MKPAEAVDLRWGRMRTIPRNQEFQDLLGFLIIGFRGRFAEGFLDMLTPLTPFAILGVSPAVALHSMNFAEGSRKGSRKFRVLAIPRSWSLGAWMRGVQKPWEG